MEYFAIIESKPASPAHTISSDALFNANTRNPHFTPDVIDPLTGKTLEIKMLVKHYKGE